MAEPNLQEIHDVLFDLAIKAGKMITSANPSTVDTKKNCTSLFQVIAGWRLIDTIAAADLVTETDQAVEAMISSSLKQKYPDYAYVHFPALAAPQSSP